MDRIKKVALWAITAVALGLLLFPYLFGSFGKSASIVQMNDDLQKVIIMVEEMTCKACAKSIDSALSKIQGVLAVSVSFEKRQASVGLDDNIKVIPINQLLTAIENIGYKPSITSE